VRPELNHLQFISELLGNGRASGMTVGSMCKEVQSRCEALLAVQRFVRSCNTQTDIEKGILRPARTSLLYCKVEAQDMGWKRKM
jgi:hypothetical protein